MINSRKSLHWLTFGLGLLIGISVAVGVLIGMKSATTAAPEPTVKSEPELEQSFKKLLHASAANSGKSLSLATGRIDDDVEGLFVLDHLTGDLYCWVVNPRGLVGFAGQYKQNILADLGLAKGKAPDYILTTGSIRPLRGGGAARPAQCIVYVGDGNSGNVVAYSLAWSPNLLAAGRPQGGPMVRVAVGKARPVLDAD